ncbi:MAG: hypothetical protein JRG84_17675 [Deltaproteobacteria bacterium]|nr:hypothetical protein [Deltaproteobacteria bacterium]
MARFSRLFLSLVAVAIAIPASHAAAYSENFLLIARGTQDTAIGAKVSSSNSLGRIYTVPSASNPDVNDSPPWPLPVGATAPQTGNYNDGNIAITHRKGTYDFSDIDIYADVGVRCQNGATGRCREGWSGSSLSGGGTFADDSILMGQIEAELDGFKATIAGLSPTDTWTVSGAGNKSGSGIWKIGSDGVDENTTITLGTGQNVIVIDTDGNDAKINNAGLVVNGAAGSSVVFILKDQEQNFLFTDASITYGMDGIGGDAIVFAMLDGGNDSNFDFSKVIVNGAKFWDLSQDGGQINMDNVQGCGQWTADHLNFNDVQLARCKPPSQAIPEPGAATLMAAGFFCIMGAVRRPSTKR